MNVRKDDLTQIDGIGPKIAGRLHDAGVLTYRELADHSADRLIQILSGVTALSAARVENWRNRARELAENTEDATIPDDGAGSGHPESASGHRYESFLVRLLLAEGDSVQSTTVQHVRTGEEKRWVGWATKPVVDFIEGHMPASSVHPGEPLPSGVAGSDIDEGTDGGSEEESSEAGRRPATGPDVEAATDPPRFWTAIATLSLDRHQSRAMKRFNPTISVELSGTVPAADRLAYSAMVVAKAIDGPEKGAKKVVAEGSGLLPLRTPTIRIDGNGLPPGTYRLDAVVTLRMPGNDRPLALASTSDGITLQVTDD